jgi:hypothetical protein
MHGRIMQPARMAADEITDALDNVADALNNVDHYARLLLAERKRHGADTMVVAAKEMVEVAAAAIARELGPDEARKFLRVVVRINCGPAALKGMVA